MGFPTLNRRTRRWLRVGALVLIAYLAIGSFLFLGRRRGDGHCLFLDGTKAAELPPEFIPWPPFARCVYPEGKGPYID